MYEIKLWDEEKNIYILTDAAGVLRDQNPDNLQLPRSCQQYALFSSRKTAQEMADRLNRKSEQDEATKQKEELARSQERLERMSLEAKTILGDLDRKRKLESSASTVKVLERYLYEAENDAHRAKNDLEIAKSQVIEFEVLHETAKLRVEALKTRIEKEKQNAK